MRGRILARESGQAMSEYAVILGAIAVGCIVAAVFLGGGIFNRFDSSSKPFTRAPLTPPVEGQPIPTTVEECENGGWIVFPQFESEDECVDFVNGPP